MAKFVLVESATATTREEQADWRWRAPELGEPRVLWLSAGELDVFDVGAGPAIVFAHGWFANANLWRGVAARLADRFRCIVLDLPFGGHRRPMPPDTDLSPTGCGRLIAESLAELGLRDATLVGADAGGAYAQVAVSIDPTRVGHLVLTSCETPFDAFPPPPFTHLPELATDLAALRAGLGALRSHEARRDPAVFGLLMRHAPDPRASDSYLLPALYDDGILLDVAAVMRSAATAEVAEPGLRLPTTFPGRVGFVWAEDDPVVPIEHARRFADLFEDAQVLTIADAYGFIGEDQPAALADAIAHLADT